jgi:hypothetical protein
MVVILIGNGTHREARDPSATFGSRTPGGSAVGRAPISTVPSDKGTSGRAELPRCSIGPRCRWFRQEGRQAWLRCPLVSTELHNPSERQHAIAG